jgi:hypothetical protein
VAVKRALRTRGDWHAMLWRYSALKASTPRALAAKSWGDAAVAGKSAAWNASWAQLRQYARELVAGQHADPCPRARGWGGSMDRVRAGQERVRCNAATANWFYRTVPAVLAKGAM